MSFEEDYPETVRHNKKTILIHQINELEAKPAPTLAERTELQRLRRKLKKC